MSPPLPTRAAHREELLEQIRAFKLLDAHRGDAFRLVKLSDMTSYARCAQKLCELMAGAHGPEAVDAGVEELLMERPWGTSGSSGSPTARSANVHNVLSVLAARFNPSKRRREYLFHWRAGDSTWEPYKALLVRSEGEEFVNPVLDAQVGELDLLTEEEYLTERALEEGVAEAQRCGLGQGSRVLVDRRALPPLCLSPTRTTRLSGRLSGRNSSCP